MKKRHVSCLFVVILALSTIFTPMNAQAATPLTAANFNATRYAQDYPDLNAVYGTNAAALWTHYVNYGAKENRKAYATNGDVGYLAATAQPVAQAAAPAQTALDVNTFNYKGYADKYADLKAAFGYNQTLLYNHYVTIGMKEGRTVPGAAVTAPVAAAAATPVATATTPSTFNYKGYADKYPDLKALYGYDAQRLYNHYISYGQKEGRTVPGASAAAAAPVATPTTTGAVFANVVPNTISVLGDSISTFNGFNRAGYYVYYPKDNVTQSAQMWWAQAAAMRGMSVLSNCSWSGSSVAGDPNKENASAGCSWRRITDIAVNGQAPAVILIMMGTNDYNFSHKLGNVGDGTWTFAGAYNIMLQKMKAAYPNTRIICLTAPPVWGANGYENNEAGYGVPAYNSKIVEIAAMHGLQVIDTYNLFSGGDSIDGVHPNAKGMGEIAAAVAAGL